MSETPSTRTKEAMRRRVSKTLAEISFKVVSQPLEYEQLVALKAHVDLMQRIVEEH